MSTKTNKVDPDDDDKGQSEEVTAQRIIAEFGWVFLRAMVKLGSFWLDSEGRLKWFRQDFERDAARVRREMEDS